MTNIIDRLEGSGAWLLSNCEDFAKIVSDSDESEDPAKIVSDSESEQGGGRYRARYRRLAHIGILFVSNE